MSNEKILDYTNLDKAVSTLDSALVAYRSLKDTMGVIERDLLRDGVIQRFEYTFELSWKTLKRYLEMYGMEKVDKLISRDFFRKCFETGLIRDPAVWFNFMLDRNRTSHVYDQEIAADVFGSAQAFIGEAKFLLSQLRERLK